MDSSFDTMALMSKVSIVASGDNNLHQRHYHEGQEQSFLFQTDKMGRPWPDLSRVPWKALRQSQLDERSDYGFRRTLAWWSLEKTFLTSSFRHWICVTFSKFSAFFLAFGLTSWYSDNLEVISSKFNVRRGHKIDAIYSAFGVKKTYYQSEPSQYEKFSFLLGQFF